MMEEEVDDTPIDEADGTQLEAAYAKQCDGLMEQTAADYLKRFLVVFKYGDPNLTDKIHNQPMCKDGSAKMFFFSAGLDATKDPRARHSHHKMKASADEDHVKDCVSNVAALLQDADTAYFVSGLL